VLARSYSKLERDDTIKGTNTGAMARPNRRTPNKTAWSPGCETSLAEAAEFARIDVDSGLASPERKL
jgi:hypothetical protein